MTVYTMTRNKSSLGRVRNSIGGVSSTLRRNSASQLHAVVEIKFAMNNIVMIVIIITNVIHLQLPVGKAMNN